MLEELQELANEYTTEKLTLSSNLRSELNLTSFDLISLISDVEEKYGIKIADDDINNIYTVQDLISYIENKR